LTSCRHRSPCPFLFRRDLSIYTSSIVLSWLQDPFQRYNPPWKNFCFDFDVFALEPVRFVPYSYLQIFFYFFTFSRRRCNTQGRFIPPALEGCGLLTPLFSTQPPHVSHHREFLSFHFQCRPPSARHRYRIVTAPDGTNLDPIRPPPAFPPTPRRRKPPFTSTRLLCRVSQQVPLLNSLGQVPNGHAATTLYLALASRRAVASPHIPPCSVGVLFS